jgi:hypothetical protein
MTLAGEDTGRPSEGNPCKWWVMGHFHPMLPATT